jgi:hypothetical protein
VICKTLCCWCSWFESVTREKSIDETDHGPFFAEASRMVSVKPGVKQTHLLDLQKGAAACKAVYAGSIPTPASIACAIAVTESSAAKHRSTTRKGPRNGRLN